MRGLAIASTLLLTGCLPVGQFACSEDGDCGAGGSCEAAGYCSLPSGSCDSGRRYTKYAPADLASRCVAEPDPVGTTEVGTTLVGSTTLEDPSTSTTASSSGETSSGSEASSGSTTTGPTPSPCIPAGRADASPVLLYDFCEGEGAEIHSVGEASYPLQFVADLATEPSLEWVDDGVRILDPPDYPESGRFTSETPLFELLDPCVGSGEVSVEIWTTPVDAGRGPMWIFDISGASGTGIRVAQNTAWAELGLRGEVQMSAGTDTTLWNGVLFERPSHVVLVRDQTGSRLYLDGEEIAATEDPGDLAGWNGNATLSIGGIPGTPARYWFGTLHIVALYCEALSPEAVQQNFEAGHRP